MASIKIALAGNPNCGKTTLFNALTGSNQFVGNWPGVTVEKKEGRLEEAQRRHHHGPARYLLAFPPTPWRKWFPVITWSRSVRTPF